MIIVELLYLLGQVLMKINILHSVKIHMGHKVSVFQPVRGLIVGSIVLEMHGVCQDLFVKE